jgi:hypothetical protein
VTESFGALSPELAEEFAALGDSGDIITFAEDPNLCGLELEPAQRVILKCTYGHKLDAEEYEVYKLLTGGGSWVDKDNTVYEPQFPREVTEQHGLNEEALWLLLACGRRSGKSLVVTTLIALFEAVCRAHIWKRHLMPGVQAYAIIVATKEDQAKDIIFKQCANLIRHSPKLQLLLEIEPKSKEIELINGMIIKALPCSSTAGRGLPVFFLGLDEAAFFRHEGKITDRDIVDSFTPAMNQFFDDDHPDQPCPKIVVASSPAAKQGLLWEMCSQDGDGTINFVQQDRAIFQASTRLMNPKHSSWRMIASERKRDPEYTMREFDAYFVERMSAFFPASLGLCYVLSGDLAPSRGIDYYAAIDQSGLAGADNFAFAIAHKDHDGIVSIDVARLWDTDDLDLIMSEISALCQRYNIISVQHDRYAAGYIAKALANMGLLGEISASLPVVYTNAKGLIIHNLFRMPDTPATRNGMANTMAVYGKNNSLSIYHERDAMGHSDIADAMCRAAFAASEESGEIYQRVEYDLASMYENSFSSFPMI